MKRLGPNDENGAWILYETDGYNHVLHAVRGNEARPFFIDGVHLKNNEALAFARELPEIQQIREALEEAARTFLTLHYQGHCQLYHYEKAVKPLSMFDKEDEPCDA